jgi:hypothetical protein
MVIFLIFSVISLYTLIIVFAFYKLLLLKETNLRKYMRQTGQNEFDFETTYMPVL